MKHRYRMPSCSSGRGDRFRRLIFYSLLSLMLPATIAWCGDVAFDGAIELRGTYDTNILLTADDYDFELRRLSGDKTEEDDFYGTLASDLKWSIPVNDFYEQKIRYRGEMERYVDFGGENAENHRLEFQPTFFVSDNVDLILEYNIEYDNRRRGAEYLRPDYLENEVGAAIDWEPYYGGTVILSYLYEDRNYKSLTGTPFDDYSGHLGRLGWEHRFSKRTWTNADLLYSLRDYADDTRDAYGDLLPGRDRNDEEAGIRLSLTHLPTPKTLLRGGYEYRDHSATGSFYDYDLHRVSGVWAQELPRRTRLTTYLHHEWRDYDHQAAQETTGGGLTGNPIQLCTDDVRADRQFLLVVNLTKELGKGFSCGPEFQYLDNRSNDDSSAYDSESYSLFVRYRF